MRDSIIIAVLVAMFLLAGTGSAEERQLVFQSEELRDDTPEQFGRAMLRACGLTVDANPLCFGFVLGCGPARMLLDELDRAEEQLTDLIQWQQCDGILYRDIPKWSDAAREYGRPLHIAAYNEFDDLITAYLNLFNLRPCEPNPYRTHGPVL